MNVSLLRILAALALMLPGLLHAQLTFDPANPPSSANPPTELYHEYTGTYSHQKGPKTVMVFLVQPSDGAAWTSPPSFATLDGQLNTGSANYYNLYSYKQAWFGPKRRSGMDIPRLIVTPLLQLPGTTQAYKDGFGQLQSDCLAAARALGGDYAEGQIKDYNNYDRWVVMSNTKLINSTGLAYVGGRFAWTDGSLSGGVAEHEWGHNWGVYHANAWNVPAGAEPRSPSGSSEEYGDGWDLMGGNTIAAGFNVLFREDLGFLERSRGEVVDATASGTYRLYDYIHPDRRQTTSLARALLVPMSSFSEPKRIFFGFGHVTSLSDSRSVWNRNALTMHTALGVSGSSRIDTTPGSRQSGDSIDSSIKIGRTYSEGPSVNGTQVNGGFHITPTARGAATVNGQTHEWMDVVINYQNDIIGNQPPVASFASNPYGIAPGASLAFSVTASDPNGDALAYDWDFGDGTLSTTNSASQSKSWSAAGFYLVSCTVSDMKGGVVTASTWINVGSQSPRPADTPAATVAGIDFERFSGAWTTLPNFNQLLPVATGTVSTISLPPGAPVNNFAVRYTGYLNSPATDIYQFSLTSEDGSRLQIGGTTVIDNDGQRSTALSQSGNAYLSAGAHAFTVELFNRDNTASINLKWRTAETASTPLVSTDFLRLDRTGNDAPAVSILSPEENAEFVAGSSVLLQASASDADGIAKVQYYSGGAYLGESATAPYAVSWSNLSPGARQVQAYAIDSTGLATLSAARNFSVVSPEPRNLISINFAGDAISGSSPGLMLAGDSAGAVYASNQWTTIRATKGYGNPFIMQEMIGTTTGLRDQTGSATTASITTNFKASNLLSNSSPADSGNSRLMRSYTWKRNAGDPGAITVSDLPYASYDVYVYFDALNTDANDIVPSAYTLNGVTKYGQNAASLVAGKGDFPNYATWADYKEATATSAFAPISERLGNYVVFRDQSGPSFTLTVGASDPVNGIQIVEAGNDTGTPGIRLLQSGGVNLTEGGGGVAYLAWLAAAPDDDVTLTLNSGSQLAANRTSLVFTPVNWQTPQAVLVNAVDDGVAEGSHTGTLNHSVTASGNYAAVTAEPLVYQITDNDSPVVEVNVVRHAAEHPATPRTGLLRFTRSDLGSYASPLMVNFVVTGTASLSGDYTLADASVNFNPGTGAGSVVIPAGQAQVVLTLNPVNDSTAEEQETAIFTLQPNAAYSIGTAPAASVLITDDDAVDYLTQPFTNNLGNTLFDLNNLSITFTPGGGTYTAQTTRVTAFPSGTSGFTPYDEAAMPSGNADDGHWEQSLAVPFTYFGVTYSTAKVATNGYVFFASNDYLGNDLSGLPEAHFVVGSPRIAGLGFDLNPGTGGTINYQRITTSGQQRHVFYYNAVRFYNGTNTTSFQIELFDDGRIRITHIGSTLISPSIVGLSSGVAATMPSSPFETTSSPRPFYPSDLSLYGDGTVTNAAPVFASQPVTSGTVGLSYSHDIVATDANHDALTLTAPVMPAWLSLMDHGNGTATLAGTPPASGSFPVMLRANDGSTSTDQLFVISILPAGGNTAPVITSVPVTQANTAVPYSYTITATDADGHALVMDAPIKPSWLIFTDHGDGSGTLAGTPPANVPAPSITLSAFDGFDVSVQSFALTLGPPPTLLVTPTNPAVIAGSTRQFSAVALDAASVPLDPQPVITWSVSGGGTITASGLLSAGTTAGAFTVTATAAGVSGSTGFTVQDAPGVSVFSAFFNNGTGSTADKAASLYHWNGAIGTSGAAVTTLANVAVSQGVTTSGTNGGVPLVTGSTSASFLFAVPATTAGVSMLFTESLATSATLQDSPQADWFRVGADSLSTLTVGDITQLSVYTRPATTATTMRFALRVGGNWVVSTTAFNQSNTTVYEQRVLTNITAANAWYSGTFTSGSFLDDNLGNNPTITLNADDPVTGYGWYADTDAQSAANSRVRIDSYVVSANVVADSPTGYANWAVTAFPAEATEGERAMDFDYDLDGLVNLLEYALGTDPASANVAPGAQLVEIDGNFYLQIQWTRPNDRSDINTIGQISSSLESWSSAPEAVSTLISLAGEGMETVTIRDLTPISSNFRRFLRVLVSHR